MKKILFALLTLVVMAGCRQSNKLAANAEGNMRDTATVSLQYVKGFLSWRRIISKMRLSPIERRALLYSRYPLLRAVRALFPKFR